MSTKKQEFKVTYTSDFLDVLYEVSIIIHVPRKDIFEAIQTARDSERTTSHINNNPLWESSVKLQVTIDGQLILFYTTTDYCRRKDIRLDFTVKNGVIKYFGRRERCPAGSDTRWK